MKKLISFLFVLLQPTGLNVCFGKSISGDMAGYREVCERATSNDWYFKNFRSLPVYQLVVEGGPLFGSIYGNAFAKYLTHHGLKETLDKLSSFRLLDTYGNAEINDFQGVGLFSATTLRYIVIANHIKKLFPLPHKTTIVEIGGGFGGQCFVLSQLLDLKKYYLFDLPEVNPLIEKMLKTLEVNNFVTLPQEAEFSELNLDLVISNYAFSECDKTTQLHYIDKIISKAKRGYIIYNTHTAFDTLSCENFVTLLKNYGITAKIYAEPIKTHDNNTLVVWGEDELKQLDKEPISHALIVVYLGETLPEHLRVALYQARLFNQCRIYLLGNRKTLASYSACKNLDITMIPVEDLIQTEEHKKFITTSTIDRSFRNGFWFYASERFLWIHDFMQQYNEKNIFVMEPDVMLYASLESLIDVFHKHYQGLGVTFSNDNLAIPGVVYINNKQAVARLAQCFAAHAPEAKNDCEILAILRQESNKDIIDGLPVIMEGYPEKYVLQNTHGEVATDPSLYTNNIHTFRSIFDGFTFGKYLGGVDPRNIWDPQQGPGHISEYCVINASNVVITWERDLLERNIPYAMLDHEKYRLNNLHVHSKDLKPFLSLNDYEG